MTAPPLEVQSAAARADWVARRYRDAHQSLPTARDLSALANVSTGTAGTYRWRIKSYSGAGTYTFYVKNP